jgi:hypothetical protein
MLQTLTELSVLDQLYIVSFSIFYGVMLHTLKGIRAFDTSAAFTGNKQPLIRFAMSVVFLNLLPFLQFSIIILYALQNLDLNIFSILIVFGLSIGIFGFDKVFHAILIKERKRLYEDAELETVVGYSSALARRFSSHYLQYLIPGVLYISVPLGALLLLFDASIGVALLVTSIAMSLVVWTHWRKSLTLQTSTKGVREPESSQPQQPL